MRQQELIPFLMPCCDAFQDVHASFVEHWPSKPELTYVDVGTIKFLMDWWVAYYHYGLKRQPTSTPGQMLSTLKEEENAAEQAERAEAVTNKKEQKKITKGSARQLANRVSKLTDEEIKERAAVTLAGMRKRSNAGEKDQLEVNGSKRQRGAGGSTAHSGPSTFLGSPRDSVLNDPRYVAMEQQVGNLQSIVNDLLSTNKVCDVIAIQNLFLSFGCSLLP